MAESLPRRSAGLGLRRALLDELIEAPAGAFDFLECAPDNWIGVGGVLGDKLETLASRHPLSCHGLSLSLGGPDPLDIDFLRKTRDFLDRHKAALYSEHLSYCTGDGHLYDLMPIPFTAEAVRHVAGRIAQVQDALGRRIAVENVSYYAAPYQALGEIEFVTAVLAEADCDCCSTSTTSTSTRSTTATTPTPSSPACPAGGLPPTMSPATTTRPRT